ncbi:Putative protein of unknown function [Podospora comata]|uniref:Ribonuclease H1 N-terminal domain-containing protein n=1 Tax=Podospora comata TaxID=48703 RepID=A0ABY6SJQ7_PODCO|nr:Putative protein of unknown function [Podospora comata]
MARKRWYAVTRGRQPGVYETWEQTEAQVLGFPDNRHKSFPTKEEAEKFVGENRNTKAEPLGDAETRDASTQPSTAGE